MALFAAGKTYYDTNFSKVAFFHNRPERLIEYFDGLRIVHISDLHTRYIGVLERRLLESLRELEPDMIFITGDFVNSSEDIPACREILNEIQKIAPIYAVLGNHDHHFMRIVVNTDKLKDTVRETGATLLVNESLRFDHNGRSLYIVGLDDNHLGYDDYKAAVEGIDDSAPRIVLAHSPEIVNHLDLSNIQLILSGHTHGGQFRLPLTKKLYGSYASPFKSGFYDQGRFEDILFITRGIGASWIPLRLGARPEIVVFDFDAEHREWDIQPN